MVKEDLAISPHGFYMSSLNFGCIFLLIATKYNLGKKRNENRKGRTERKEKGKGIQSTTRTSQPSKKMREKKL